MPLTIRQTAGLHGFVQWIGEAFIGLIPYIVFVAVHRYSSLPITATCPKQAPNPITGQVFSCTPLHENASQEICILAVVISGLALLSVAPIRQPSRPITVFTYLLILLAIGSLIFGALFYALFTAHLDQDADAITYLVLATALGSSLFLALEGAIIDA
jgi:hypothetical protein